MAKVAIVGCGAMGSVYAALMAEAGHEVHAVTLWPDHAGAMRTHGLRVEGASRDRTVRLVSAGTDTNGIGPCDLVVIATKAFDVEAAARSSVKLLGPDTVVQTIQNDLGSPEVAAPILGKDRIVVGVVGGFGASMRVPGHAHHNGMEMIRFGAFAGLPTRSLRDSARI
jgi:2-dehydropantoate 2-reductase